MKIDYTMNRTTMVEGGIAVPAIVCPSCRGGGQLDGGDCGWCRGAGKLKVPAKVRMNLNRILTIIAIVLGLLLATLCVWGGPLTISWNTVPTADHYHVYAATNAGQWFTNWATQSNSTVFQLDEPGLYYFAVAAGREESNYFAASPLSEAVCFELLNPPPIDGTPHVRLVTVFEASTNLVAWHSVTSAATWIAATNAMEFYRNPELRIEKATIPK